MTAYHLFSCLPAILGIAGFFAYLWGGQSKIGGDILRKIVEKLRADPTIHVGKYGQLTPAKLRSLVEHDAQVRNAVNQGDRDLLRLLIIFQYMLTALALLVCATLIGVSVWLYARPAPFSLAQSGLGGVTQDAEGLLVDLDPIEVQWTHDGPDQLVAVFLENVDSRQRTAKQTVRASTGSARFTPAQLSAVVADRSYQGKNRIRSVIEWPNGLSLSPPQDVLVGIVVELQLFGRLVTIDGEERDIHTLLATIDRSTERMPADYRFKGDFVARTPEGPMVVALASTHANGEVDVPGLDRVDWALPVGFIYGGPDDRRIVRSHVYGKK